MSSMFTAMLAEVRSRPSIFAQDPTCRSPAYAKWLGSAAYRKVAGTKKEAAEWRRFRDAELKAGTGERRTRATPKPGSIQLHNLSGRSKK